MPSNLEELCTLLAQGAARFEALGDRPIASDFDTTGNIVQFIKEQIEEIRNGKMTLENGGKLWDIFAPTCEWDDYVHDSLLGEAIFMALDVEYRPRRNKKS